MRKVFIPGNVPSLKNSKIKTVNGIFPSKTVTKYLRSLGIKHYSLRDKIVIGYKRTPNSFDGLISGMKNDLSTVKEWPIKIGFHFIRDSKRDFDFVNACQIILDLVVAHNVIPDDSMKYIIPIPVEDGGAWYSIDKEKPGVIIYY
jgi:hypothetical protein